MNLDKVIAVRVAKTVYIDGDKVLKVFNGDYSKADILNEALNQARVEETSLNVPKLLEVTKVDGNWAIVMEHIEGSTLDELMNKNPEKMDEYLEKFVDLQTQMHSLTVPKLNKLKDKMNAKMDESGLDSNVRYELHQRLAGMPKHKKLCHGDFNPKNVIVTADDKWFVIDWAHATQGNASADVARTYLLFALEGKTEIADKYLSLFAKKTNTDVQYVQKWLPIVAASQLVKGNAAEKEFLLKWTNVVEYV